MPWETSDETNLVIVLFLIWRYFLPLYDWSKGEKNIIVSLSYCYQCVETL